MNYNACSQLSLPTLICSIIEKELEASSEFEAQPHIIHLGDVVNERVSSFYASTLHCNSDKVLIPEVGKFIVGMSKLTSNNLGADIGAVCLPCDIDPDGNVRLYPSLPLNDDDELHGYFAIVDDGKDLSCMLIQVTGRSPLEALAVPTQTDMSSSLIKDVLTAWEIDEEEWVGVFLRGEAGELEADSDLFAWDKVDKLHAVH